MLCETLYFIYFLLFVSFPPHWQTCSLVYFWNFQYMIYFIITHTWMLVLFLCDGFYELIGMLIIKTIENDNRKAAEKMYIYLKSIRRNFRIIRDYFRVLGCLNEALTLFIALFTFCLPFSPFLFANCFLLFLSSSLYHFLWISKICERLINGDVK